MLAITHARLVLPDRELPDGMILCENGKLIYAGEGRKVPEGAQVLNAGGLYAGPGFVDQAKYTALNNGVPVMRVAE